MSKKFFKIEINKGTEWRRYYQDRRKVFSKKAAQKRAGELNRGVADLHNPEKYPQLHKNENWHPPHWSIRAASLTKEEAKKLRDEQEDYKLGFKKPWELTWIIIAEGEKIEFEGLTILEWRASH